MLFAYLVMVVLRPFSYYTKNNLTCPGVRTSNTCTLPVEIIVYIWMFTFIIEEVRQVSWLGNKALMVHFQIRA